MAAAAQIIPGNQDYSLPRTNPAKVQEPGNQLGGRRAGQFNRRLLFVLYLHFVFIIILVVFLNVRGLLSAARHHNHFRPRNWYPPALVSTASTGIVAFGWQWITRRHPSKAIRAAFWLSPLLTCAVGVLLLAIGSAGGLAAAVIALISSLIQSLYGCWASPRFHHATRDLTLLAASPPAKTNTFLTLSIVAGVLYSCFLVSGIGGATSTRTKLDILFIFIILVSLAWTMHVIKNTLQVTFARVKYMHFAYGRDFDTVVAFQDTIKHSLGSVCVGSALVPVLGLIRGSARALSLVAGDTGEFMFSCASCYSSVASGLVRYGNRWGFVQVGVYDKGFVQASADTWEMFNRVGMEALIDTDLTGAFCFLCGVVGGAVGALAGGSWALAVQKGYAIQISISAFLIGYLMTRTAMSLQQASVLAYYVAYAENPQNRLFNSNIPDRIREIQRSQA